MGLFCVAVTLHSETTLAESSPYGYYYSTPNLIVQLNHKVNFGGLDNENELETIDGEILQVQRDDSGLKIQSDTSEVNIKLGDIETEFGLIHIIDSVLI